VTASDVVQIITYCQSAMPRPSHMLYMLLVGRAGDLGQDRDSGWYKKRDQLPVSSVGDKPQTADWDGLDLKPDF
jgi:hypothetical protein